MIEIHEGMLAFLGNSSSRGETRSYTMIRIGETELRDVKVSDYLDNYLQLALNGDDKTILYFYKFPLAARLLVAVRHGKRLGKTRPASTLGQIGLLALGLVTLPFGLLFIYGVFARWRFNSALAKLN